MAFTRPTLAEIISSVETDLASRLEIAGALLRRSMAGILARVVAGAEHMLHGHLAFLADQLFPDLSEAEYLVRQASLYGLALLAPTYAHGTATATGTTGITIPASTRLTRADGSIYTTDADVTLAAGTGTLALTATEAGSAGTLVAAQVLTFETPIPGVDSTAQAAASTADGSDEELYDSLRARLVARIQSPPHGGTEADYVAWAREIAGVTRVWVTPQGLGPGTVVVRFVRDGDASPIPDVGEVAAVQARLDERSPVHATVTAVAPTPVFQTFTVHVVPDTSAIRAAVTASLEDLILAQDPGGTLLRSSAQTAVGTSPGVVDYSVAAPPADVVYGAGELPLFSPITWI